MRRRTANEEKEAAEIYSPMMAHLIIDAINNSNQVQPRSDPLLHRTTGYMSDIVRKFLESKA
jgi:hypothetical protein